MKLRQCIECSHLADPVHVYPDPPHYEWPHKTWWQTWHRPDKSTHQLYFTDVRFWPELKKYILGGRAKRNRAIKHMAELRRREHEIRKRLRRTP